MSTNNTTIIINGVAYDAVTGLRVSASDEGKIDDVKKTARPVKKKSNAQVTTSRSLHKKPDRTRTLVRSHIKQPAGHEKLASKPTKATVQRSPMVTKFSDIKPAERPQASSAPDIRAAVHPAQQIASEVKHPAVQTSVKLKSSQEIKKQAISKALAGSTPQKSSGRSFLRRHPRAVSLISATLAFVLLAGYLAYINLPNLSVRMAALHAGIAAEYPSYRPAGYSLNGPVASSNGQVSMEFKANVGPQTFTINQTKSNWDSSALLDNYIKKVSHGQYTTYADSGLTVYTYGRNAAWVNGGILYTIQGDAPLTDDQIRHMATSM